MSIFQLKSDLYHDYCTELNEMRNMRRMSDADIEKAFNYYINCTESTWINLYPDDGSEPVGFLIIGKEIPEKHPEGDFEIAQAYVKPEYRHRKIMTKGLTDYLSRHKGVWTALVLKSNTYAEGLWDSIFFANGYEPADLFYNSAYDTETVLKSWKPSGKKSGK